MKAQVFYPASRFDADLLAKGVSKAQSLGLEIICPPAPEPQWFHCASLDDRRRNFLEALKGPAEILWASRGGYGTAQFLDDLTEDLSLWKGKSLVGFSDLTSLHAWTSNRNIISFHAPMIATRGWTEATQSEIDSWTSSIVNQQPEPLLFQNSEINPISSGRLIGGNLTVLASLMGTPHQLKLRSGDILFLEDIQEPPYRLSRALFQLSYSPHFKEVQILWGQLTDCGTEDEKSLIEKLMENYDNPWGLGLSSGHGRPNLTLPLGTRASIRENILQFQLS